MTRPLRDELPVPGGPSGAECLVLIDHWPLVGLRVRTARLELRLPTEPELAELADLAAAGIAETGRRTFLTPWTELPPADRARAVVQSHWRQRGTWTPEDWSLEMVVFVRGRPVGLQELRADRFRILRQVSTSSWLGLDHQGRGIGTEMRAAVLHLAFDGLGAGHATTESFVDNHAPRAVSRKLGYRPDGIARDVLDDGTVMESQRMRLTRDDWARVNRPEVIVTGLKPCLPQFGI
jgi:RimJ/RimL family protein N-acetyltransferase